MRCNRQQCRVYNVIIQVIPVETLSALQGAPAFVHVTILFSVWRTGSQEWYAQHFKMYMMQLFNLKLQQNFGLRRISQRATSTAYRACTKQECTFVLQEWMCVENCRNGK